MNIQEINSFFQELYINTKDFMGIFYTPVSFLFKILGVIIITVCAVKLGKILIFQFFAKQKQFKYIKNSNNRIDTLTSLTVSFYKYSVYTVSVVSILTIILDALNLGTVLAAAGIGGIAIGFGAQSLIKDMLSGVFILLEDQYMVGDLITIDGLIGTVEDFELRVTKIRNHNGDLYTIPNGEITRVVNHTRGNKSIVVEVPFTQRVDIKKVYTALENVCNIINEEYKDLLVEDLDIKGVTNLNKDGSTVRLFGRCIPNEQWGIERRVKTLVRDEFYKEKIEFSDINKIITNSIFENGG